MKLIHHICMSQDDSFGISCCARSIDNCDEVIFGDTKEGCFAVRVPGSMAVTANMGGKLANDRGQTDDAAWGRCATWVNYTGPVDGEPAGIAIFIHPESVRAPHRWHVRTYGLFAANPFALREFPQDDEQPKGGPLVIPQGESAKFRYLVLFHGGDLTADQLNDWQKRYAADELSRKNIGPSHDLKPPMNADRAGACRGDLRS